MSLQIVDAFIRAQHPEAINVKPLLENLLNMFTLLAALLTLIRYVTTTFLLRVDVAFCVQVFRWRHHLAELFGSCVMTPRFWTG